MCKVEEIVSPIIFLLSDGSTYINGSTIIVDGDDCMVKEIQLKNIKFLKKINIYYCEIGNNHNGEMEIAKKLIDEAHKCGVSAVKFQTKDIETAFPQELLNKNYEGPNSFGKTYRSINKF